MTLQQRSKQQGFTLIELMIVVAIIGILAAFAVPAYQDFTVRSRVSEGLNLASGAKAAVADYYATENAMPTTNAMVGLPLAASITGDAVTSVTIGTAGAIAVLYNSKVAASGTPTLTLTPTAANGSMKWVCTKNAGLTNQQVPKTCR